MTKRIQISNYTLFMRHQSELAVLKLRLAQTRKNKFPLRILSFGSSLGYEAFSLRCAFPDALIFGCDINRDVLNYARSKNQDPHMFFFESNAQNIRQHGPYDLIFIASVFTRHPKSRHVKNLNTLMRFKDVDSIFTMLTQNLADKGLMCLFNSHYLFGDLTAAKKYVPVRSPRLKFSGFVGKFAPDGHRLTRSVYLPNFYNNHLSDRHFYAHEVIDTAHLTDNDIFDCVFEKTGAKKGMKKPVILKEKLLPVSEKNLIHKIEHTPDLDTNHVYTWSKQRIYKTGRGNFVLYKERRQKSLTGKIISRGTMSKNLSNLDVQFYTGKLPANLTSPLKRRRFFFF